MTTTTTMPSLPRRDFLKTTAAVAGGLTLELSLPLEALAADKGAPVAHEVTAWVMIHPDDRIVIRVARSEMGQGSFTGLPMLVAEELACDWGKVSAEYASPNEHVRRNRIWQSMSTGGSAAIRTSQEYLRRAGATAREMLIAAAAQQWGVPASECTAANSVITHVPSKREVTFGKVAEAAAKLEPPKEVKLKDPKDWTLIGQSMKRFDIPDKVMGKPVFGIDAVVPGMVYAAIVQCPIFGGKLKLIDSSAAEKMRGVLRIVAVDEWVAVVADNWWRAQQATKKLKIEWDDRGNGAVSSESILEFFKQGLDDPTTPTAKKVGDIAPAFASAAKVVEAEYFAPFLNHATLEPQTCTASIKDGKVEVWTSTQNAEASMSAAAEAAGVKLEDVEVHKMQLGGGFGRRGASQDFVRQAVQIAKTVGKPVKLIWSREEDMQHGFYRPATLARLKAAIDANGNVTAWHTRLANGSIIAFLRPDQIKNGIDMSAVGAFADLPYAIDHQQVDYSLRTTPVPLGFWRAVAHSQNPFMRECFVDELAQAAGRDPYPFRRAMLKDKLKDLAVLDAVAKAANWEAPATPGVFRGIAVQSAFGSFTAAVIEVSMPGGKLKLERVIVAVDCGYVVNPDAARAQIESSVVYGLTAALFGEITLKNGRVVQSNFDDYPMMRLKDMPKVEALLVPSGGFWGGMGEPPLAPLAPALCNAIFAATGKRIRSLPLKQHGLVSI